MSWSHMVREKYVVYDIISLTVHRSLSLSDKTIVIFCTRFRGVRLLSPCTVRSGQNCTFCMAFGGPNVNKVGVIVWNFFGFAFRSFLFLLCLVYIGLLYCVHFFLRSPDISYLISTIFIKINFFDQFVTKTFPWLHRFNR